MERDGFRLFNPARCSWIYTPRELHEDFPSVVARLFGRENPVTPDVDLHVSPKPADRVSLGALDEIALAPNPDTNAEPFELRVPIDDLSARRVGLAVHVGLSNFHAARFF